jgi:hypothetical protein
VTAGRPADPDVLAAGEARGQRALADLARLDLRSLSRLSLSLGDAEARAPLREAAIRAADREGLGPPLREMRSAARDYVIRAFDQGGFLAIGVDLGESRSRARTDERVAVMVAAEDDVIAAIAAPFVSDEVRIALTTPMDRLHPDRAADRARPPAGLPTVALGDVRVRRTLAVGGFAVLVVASVILVALGSGVGTFGLAAAIGIALVAIVARGRIRP